MGGASLPSMTVRIFRPWTISLVAAELLSAAGYAALKACLVASGACIAAPRHASKLRPYEIAVCNVEIEAFTRCQQCELSLCTPLLEPVARLSARRRQSALTGMKTLGLVEIVLSIVPFRSLRTALRSLTATLAPAAMAIAQCNIRR